VAAVSARGTSHEKKGQPCQDANAFEILPSGVLVAAVADGAGSAARSEMGSALAVHTALASIRRDTGVTLPVDEREWRVVLKKALEVSRQSLEDQAASLGISSRELATTLIVVAATADGVAVAQIGDGAAVARDSEGAVVGLTQPRAGEYINETTFLISPNAIEDAQCVYWPGKATHLAVLSDGLQMLALKMPCGLPHDPFFAPLFRFVEQVQDAEEANEKLSALLRSPRVTARCVDDLTLLLAARRE
jgi:hypothetical protein